MDNCEFKADLVYIDGPRTVIVTYLLCLNNQPTNKLLHTLFVDDKSSTILFVSMFLGFYCCTNVSLLEGYILRNESDLGVVLLAIVIDTESR